MKTLMICSLLFLSSQILKKYHKVSSRLPVTIHRKDVLKKVGSQHQGKH